jgi:hypothetical protein
MSQFQPNQALTSEVIMKSSIWLFAAAMSVAGLAMAQSAPSSTVTEINDPAKIAEIERHAQELAGQQQKTPAMSEHEHMHKPGMRHHKDKPMHKRGKKHMDKDKAPSETPMATDSKG